MAQASFDCDGTWQAVAGPGWFFFSHKRRWGDVTFDIVDAGTADEGEEGHAIPPGKVEHGVIAAGQELVIRGPAGAKVNLTREAEA